MIKKCKKCLLLDAGESVAYEEIMRYIQTMDEKDLAKRAVFEERIARCKNCDNLISGMCLKCGCYVEVRARLKNAECPDYDDKKW